MSGCPQVDFRKSIEVDQVAKLRLLLAKLEPSNRFYSFKLRDAKFSGDTLTLKAFFSKMPFTSKSELIEDQRNNPPFGSNLTFPLEKYNRFNQTSATTGQSMIWLDTPETWNWMLSNWNRVYGAANVSVNDRVFFGFSFGPFLGFWTAFESATGLGLLSIPGGGMSSLGRLKTIIDNKVTVLCCTPTYAIRLGEIAQKNGIRLSSGRVKKIIVAGEPGGSISSTINKIQRFWGDVAVFDHHGMTETGPVTYGCPRRNGILHVMESAFIAEVINPDNERSVSRGELGELILTTLGRVGSPLIRYRTGDLVKVGASVQCACGTYDLSLEGGILSRSDDMVIIRGVNLYPSAMEEIVRKFDEIEEYRVEIDTRVTLVEIKVQIELMPHAHEKSQIIKEELEAKLRSIFGIHILVEVVLKGSLPRFEFKSQRWIQL